MSLLRVLVSRPEPGASATAARLIALGFEPVVWPLSRTVALPVGPIDFEGAKAVLVTSANAIRHAPAGALAALSRLSWLAVGDMTAAACAKAGVQHVESVDGDAVALGDAVLAQYLIGDHLIYLAGRVRRPELEARLAAAGLLVSPIETYDTVEIAIDPASATIVADIGLIYSPNAGATLAKLRAEGKFDQSMRWIAISQRAAEPLIAQGIKVQVAAQPTEAAMLSLLSTLGASQTG